MSVEKSENELNYSLSTYGVITAERILGRYQIQLTQENLIEALKSPYSFYHRLLKIPLKNVLTGIILQQANDYHVYAQKLFIDYLLSGENAKGEEAQGAMVRESLEEERQQLVTLGEEYHKKEGQHNQLISSSQLSLMNIAQNFNKALEESIKKVSATLHDKGAQDVKSTIRQAINHALVHCDLNDPQLQSNQFLFTEKLNEILNIALTPDLKMQLMDNLAEVLKIVLELEEHIQPYANQGEELHVEVNSFREQFYNAILRIVDLLKLLPEYKINPLQDEINREPLHFDKNIGLL